MHIQLMLQLVASSPNSSDDRCSLGDNGTLRSANINGTLRSTPSSFVTDTEGCIKNIRCNKLNSKLKWDKYLFATNAREENQSYEFNSPHKFDKTTCIRGNRVSYHNFVRGLLFDDIQLLIGRFEILGTLCCTICEVPRRAEKSKGSRLTRSVKIP